MNQKEIDSLKDYIKRLEELREKMNMTFLFGTAQNLNRANDIYECYRYNNFLINQQIKVSRYKLAELEREKQNDSNN